MNHVLGTKFKLIMGYKGSGEAMLAVERGEVEGHSTSWIALKVAHPDWRPDKNDHRSSCSSRSSGIPRCPTSRPPSSSRATTSSAPGPERGGERRRGRLRLLHDARRAGRTALDALRRAFDATMKDPEFLAEVERTKLTVNPFTGEELQNLVRSVSNISPELVEKVRAAYSAKANSQLEPIRRGDGSLLNAPARCSDNRRG